MLLPWLWPGSQCSTLLPWRMLGLSCPWEILQCSVFLKLSDPTKHKSSCCEIGIFPPYHPYSNKWLYFPPKMRAVFNLQHCILQHMKIWTQYEFVPYRKENVNKIWFRSRLPSEKTNTIFTHDITYVSKLYFWKLTFGANVGWC